MTEEVGWGGGEGNWEKITIERGGEGDPSKNRDGGRGGPLKQ